jgi:hypothetical protein
MRGQIQIYYLHGDPDARIQLRIMTDRDMVIEIKK